MKNLHVDSQPFYDLIKDSTPFRWTHEHEKLFQSIKNRNSEDTILAVPSTDYLFHIHVDSLNVGTGCILIQQFPEGKCIISFTLDFPIKPNRKCLLYIENFVEQSQLYKLTNITSLDLLFLYIYIVITNRFFTYGDVKDNYHTASFDIKKL